MLTRIFGHWKSTLVGMALAAFHVFQAGANWKQLLLAAATAALGAFSKDH